MRDVTSAHSAWTKRIGTNGAPMKRLYIIAAFLCVLLFVQTAHAQTVQPPQTSPTVQIGQTCVNLGSTQLSYIQTQGVIECIPDTSGNLFWQPMGAGGTRYDNSAACTTAGMLRWNGNQIQYCDGSQWQNFGGVGQTLVVGGCLTAYQDCPAGYIATSYFSPGTYNCCDRCGNPSWKYTVCSQ